MTNNLAIWSHCLHLKATLMWSDTPSHFSLSLFLSLSLSLSLSHFFTNSLSYRCSTHTHTLTHTHPHKRTFDHINGHSSFDGNLCRMKCNKLREKKCKILKRRKASSGCCCVDKRSIGWFAKTSNKIQTLFISVLVKQIFGLSLKNKTSFDIPSDNSQYF